MTDRVRLIPGDCLRVMRLMAALGIQVDSIVTDPPYHLTSIVKRFGAENAAPAKAGKTGAYKRASAGFMGKKWDGGDIAFDPETWALAMAVLKPGGHLLAFGGTRGWHRMAVAIEDAGFEIRDTVAFMYGSGFPKSHNTERAIAVSTCELPGRHFKRVSSLPSNPETNDHVCPITPESEPWDGFGTALKPAFEPIVLARKPLIGSVAANVLAHGTGAINVDGCRVEAQGRPAREIDPKPEANGAVYAGRRTAGKGFDGGSKAVGTTDEGRWPANVCHDGSEEVEAAFAAFGERAAGGVVKGHEPSRTGDNGIYGQWGRVANSPHADSGSAARFFYSAKAGPEDRFGSKHPTVKPVVLMRWLVRMITPPGGLVLDPFAGSGSTGIAAIAEGMRAILIEADPEHQADIREHLAWATGKGRHALSSKARNKEGAKHDDLPLFREPKF